MDAVPGAEARIVIQHGGERLSIGSACWSPDGTHIAYTALISMDPYQEDIYVSPSNDGTSELLVTGEGWRSRPAWSPDGVLIAYGNSQDGNNDIWTIPANGGSPPTQLTFEPGSDYSPAWSPDGTQIAFTSDRAGNPDIWVMTSTGGNPTQLTFDAAVDANPSWSPDGSQVVFQSDRSGKTELWLMVATGEGTAQ